MDATDSSKMVLINHDLTDEELQELSNKVYAVLADENDAARLSTDQRLRDKLATLLEQPDFAGQTPLEFILSVNQQDEFAEVVCMHQLDSRLKLVLIESETYGRTYGLLDIQGRFEPMSLEVIERDTDRNFYLDAQQAVDYGLVDQVLAPPKPEEKK